MDISAAFVAYFQAPKPVQPRQGALDYPAMAPQALARLELAAGNARGDAALAQGLPILARVIRFVGVQLARPAARTTTRTADRRNGIDHLGQHRGFMRVGSRMADRQRRAASVHD